MTYGRVYLDFETRSEADLGEVGARNYSLHPSTEVVCMCYRLRDGKGARGPVREWSPLLGGTGCPDDLSWAVRGAYEVEAHNYSFELAIWQNVCVPRYGFPAVYPRQWRDTMAVACYYALPAKLDGLLRALGLPGKDAEGGRLISKYSKLYLKTARREIPPEDLRKFIDYCATDVLREEAVSDYLGDLPERELPWFWLDQKVNMRGLRLDLEGIRAASEVVDRRSAELTGRFREVTGLNPTQGAKLLAWFGAQGLPLPNMQAETLKEVLTDEEDPLPQGKARDALTLRLLINKASTKKLDAMARYAAQDGVARWQARYHGAQTGRDTGSGFQPLNLARGFEDVDPDMLVRDVMRRDPAWLDAVYGDAIDAVSKASRHWIVAPPGHRILAGDFVSIEAVVLACLAGEEWKVQAFREGKKLYELMGDKIYRLPEGTVTKKTHPRERQDGKTGELAFGYQGALNAWLKFDRSKRHSDERIIEICKAWRAEHPAIVAFWRGLEEAALSAVGAPGAERGYRDVGFELVDEWLSMTLPNGKRIWYFAPEIKMGMPQWHKPLENEDCASGECRCRPVPKLTYMAQKAGQWKRTYTYGGKLAENATQAAAREYMNPSALAVEDAGYPVIMKVYDEIVCAVPEGRGSKAEFIEIMRSAPGREWAKGWPIGVDAWEGQRYRK